MQGNVLTVERIIAAPAGAIFDLLADVDKHALIDGSGTVQQRAGAPRRLQLGSTFGMSMHMGVPYSMVSTVIEFEENRRIAWQTRFPGPLRRVAAGRIWRYELDAVEGGTRVRESWDLSQDKQRAFFKMGRMPTTTKLNMDKTLERIEELVTARAS